MFDMRNAFKVLGYTRQNADGSFDVYNGGTTRYSTNTECDLFTVRAMVSKQKH